MTLWNQLPADLLLYISVERGMGGEPHAYIPLKDAQKFLMHDTFMPVCSC